MEYVLLAFQTVNLPLARVKSWFWLFHIISTYKRYSKIFPDQAIVSLKGAVFEFK